MDQGEPERTVGARGYSVGTRLRVGQRELLDDAIVDPLHHGYPLRFAIRYQARHRPRPNLGAVMSSVPNPFRHCARRSHLNALVEHATEIRDLTGTAQNRHEHVSSKATPAART